MHKLALACGARTPPPPSPPPAVATLPLGERLAREAQARPADTVSSEQVLASLERAGIALARRRQVLASTLGAAYCTSALTVEGLALAVCEFSAPELARRGLSYSRETFDRLLPGRRLLLNRKTLLTLTVPAAKGAAAAQARAAAEIFAAL